MRYAFHIPWAILTITVLLEFGSVLLGVQMRAYEPPALLSYLNRVLLFLPALLTSAALGALVASRHPWHPIGWLLLMLGAVGCAGEFAEGVGHYIVMVQADTPLLGASMLWIGVLLYGLGPYLLALVLLLFPDGRLPSPRWRPVLWLILLSLPLLLVSMALTPGPIDVGGMPELNPNNPFGIISAKNLLELLETIAGSMLLVGFLFVFLSFILRFVRSTGIERQQLKWFAYGASVYAVSFIMNLAVPNEFGGVMFAFWAVSSSIVALAVGLAVLKYRLYDIDIIINRTLVYGVLTGTLVLIYFGSVVMLESLFRTLTGQSSELAIVVSTLAIAALFNPLRHSIQAFIDKRFYRRKYDAQKTLTAFSTTLRNEVELDNLSEELLKVIDETMQPSYVSLWLREERPVDLTNRPIPLEVQ